MGRRFTALILALLFLRASRCMELGLSCIPCLSIFHPARPFFIDCGRHCLRVCIGARKGCSIKGTSVVIHIGGLIEPVDRMRLAWVRS
jgi:hypothetical protein